MTVEDHGNARNYKSGCRCQECRDAFAQNMREYRARLAAKRRFARELSALILRDTLPLLDPPLAAEVEKVADSLVRS